MKKQILTKVLLACFIMAMSGFVMNLLAQGPIVVEFTNPDGADYGSSNEGFLGVGIGGSGSGATAEGQQYAVDDPYLELKFSIGPTGQIDLDAITPTAYQAVVDVVNTWDQTAIGATDNADLFGKSFSLIVTAESRMQLGLDVDGNRGGLGVRGRNQRRIDDEGVNNEWMQVELVGDAGIEFTRVGYNDVSGGDLAHMILKDHDTDSLIYILDGVDGNPHPEDLYVDAADYNMRYFSDILWLSTADTMNAGYRLYSLEFNVVAAQPKPPAVVETAPAHADTTMETTDPYVITFDLPIDQGSAASAITFEPDVSNRVDTWNEDGTELTISFDQLPYSTDYIVSISDAISGTNGLTMLADTTFTFKTLPEPPSVIYTFPANLANDVPVTTPFELQFSKGMVPDSVEKSIDFTPAVAGLDFIWNSDNSTVYFSTDALSESTQYFVTVGTVATDRFGVQLAAPFQFVFTTVTPVGIENGIIPEMVIYPNPADDIMSIRGIDVKTARIHSIAGQLVREIKNTPLIYVGDIAPGSYVISVQDRDKNKYQELIIIK